MSKRQTGWTETKIARYLKDGRGLGELSSYKPWLTIQDVPSKGRVHRVMGWKTEREHQLLSDMEFNYFCLCDWAEDIIDIREQFPLNREVTLNIADELGIKHSRDKQTPIVMTTDFLLTVREGRSVVFKARTVKLSKDLVDSGIIGKFEIERAYWENQGIEWGIVTELEFPDVLLSNLKFLHQGYAVETNELMLFLSEWKNFEGKVLANLKLFDAKYNFEDGTGISLFKYSLFKRILRTDMAKPIVGFQEDVKNIEVSKQHEDIARWA
ncbi:TnsA endonuclease N-terminal domain-containing protein [Cytobacillus horneckiae]|uniref:TnsA endonuclease N-terminal domain-containing protein n=1 Tax=Cytobacillus horneckiae TaxID=549687 RepID=UPI00203A8005|nr:TnsA endonuclease N-terminal domain-containing protein [Cytobacillus horneckiae]MCM3181165.1 TnsA endonuclease N-terminal domain-containing protein [Cytobacillus horneckiae]